MTVHNLMGNDSRNSMASVLIIDIILLHVAGPGRTASLVEGMERRCSLTVFGHFQLDSKLILFRKVV